MAQQLFNFANGSNGGGAMPLGSNQYGGGWPQISSASAGSGASAAGTNNIPGIVPGSGGYTPNTGGQITTPYAPAINNKYYAGSTLDPALTMGFFNYLQGKMGEGVSPFNLSSLLPSSGKATQAGQMTAPNNALLQQIMQGYMGNGPDSGLASMMRTGNPIDQTPAWNAMVDSMSQNIARNQANLKEQFAVGGNLVGTPYGDAMQNFMSQTSKDENAMLLGAQTNAMENAQSRMMQAGQQGSQFGQYMQGLDQSSIDRMMQEFIRTSPESNPLLQYMMGASTTFPQYMQKSSGGGILGGLLGAAGPILSGIGSIMAA